MRVKSLGFRVQWAWLAGGLCLLMLLAGCGKATPEKEYQAGLEALRKGAAGPQSIENNLLALAVEAARARATLGEISSAMEDSFARYATVPTPVSETSLTEISAPMRAAASRSGRVGSP